MKLLRSHNLRITTVVLLLCGFGICSIQPVQASGNSKAFARWLSTMANQSDMAEIRHELDQLKQSHEELDEIIEKASQLVTENKTKFNFSIQNALASQVYQFLLLEWNQFKTDNAMAKVPVRPNVKLSVPVNPDKINGFTARAGIPARTFSESAYIMTLIPEKSLLQISLTPMADGIAIGAP